MFTCIIKINKYLTRSMIEFIKMAIPGIEKKLGEICIIICL